uniref:Uncharacterized protein n=1 Tax=Romanomermis culicivorax TaxID=13658 RepID=A0A915IL11_ROMCU
MIKCLKMIEKVFEKRQSKTKNIFVSPKLVQKWRIATNFTMKILHESLPCHCHEGFEHEKSRKQTFLTFLKVSNSLVTRSGLPPIGLERSLGDPFELEKSLGDLF